MQPYYKQMNQVFLKKKKIRIKINYYVLPKISASFKQSISPSGLFFDTSTNISKLRFILSEAVAGGVLGSVFIGSTERNFEKSVESVGGAISRRNLFFFTYQKQT